MKLILVALLFLSASETVHADPMKPPPLNAEMGYKKMTETQALEFEKALELPGVQCADVVTIATGGTMGTSSASICNLNETVIYACRNDMTGDVATSSDVPVDARASTGLNLTAFILNNCVGG